MTLTALMRMTALTTILAAGAASPQRRKQPEPISTTRIRRSHKRRRGKPKRSARSAAYDPAQRGGPDPPSTHPPSRE